ncbi:MAG: response regulator transcription factor [Thermoleophilaceae bacterium]|nr:response regulator transcription factor [Thermoleophilaceae bacterium]
MKKMVLVADSSFVIETIRLALRSAAGLNVIGKVDGRASVRRPIADSQPDIILVDEMQSSENALERIRECREEAPSSVILLLTMRMEDGWVSEALAAGCDACLSKSAHLPSLGTLIREIVARNIVTALPAALAEGKLPLGSGGDDLTAREREILGLVSDGLTNARIGRELWVTEQTVKFHLSNIYRKLGVSNRTEASRYAYTHGLLRRGPARPAAGAELAVA